MSKVVFADGYQRVVVPQIEYNYDFIPSNPFPIDIYAKVDQVKQRTTNSPTFKWISSGTSNTPYSTTTATTQEQPTIPQSSQSISSKIRHVEVGDTISNEMFENLVHAEGKNNWTAAKGTKYGEDFVTGPLGQVYKYNAKGEITGTFKEGEKVTAQEAEENARRHYAAAFKEWKDLLAGKPDVTQEKLDALVSATQGTRKSKKATMDYVLNNWGNWDKIDHYLRTHAVTAAGNGKVQPGLVLRRQFEADWFKGIKKPFSWYQKNRKLYNV